MISKKNFGQELDMQANFSNLTQHLEALINAAPVMLFMKGSAESPKCGFSAHTVQMLNSCGQEFKTFDILANSEVRQGLKEYSHWPTYPQLYIKGKLVGGNDIVTELFESGELQEMLKDL